MSDGFLSRWSRLKRGDPAAAPVPAPAEADAPPELPPEELEARLAELPALDDIGPATDVTKFLQTWVPKALRDAALRKAWTSDPRISGFIEVADFQWDWNVPGGAPGCGPLEAGFDANAHVDRMVAETKAYFARDTVQDDRDVRSQPPDPDGDAAVQQIAHSDAAKTGGEEEQDVATTHIPLASQRDGGDEPLCAAQHAEPEEVIAPRRRHGGALPG